MRNFNVSYFGGPINNLSAIGSDGSVTLNPAYVFGTELQQTIVIGNEEKKKSFKNTDHFGGELKYFSDCVLTNTDPEPDGEEGFADVRVLEGILEALNTGKSVSLPPFSRPKRINTATQKIELPAVKTPQLVNASNPGKGTEKQPKN